MSQTGHVLVLCTGNVCRSPYVQFLVQRAVDDIWGSGAIEVRSAGLQAAHGSPMERRSAAALRSSGVEPHDFVARQVTAQHVAEADLILTMTRGQRSSLVKQWPSALRRSFALTDFVHLSGYVPDAQLPVTTDAREWLVEVTAVVASQQGMHGPLAPEVADIADPFGRDDSYITQMVDKVEAVLPGLRRALGAR